MVQRTEDLSIIEIHNLVKFVNRDLTNQKFRFFYDYQLKAGRNLKHLWTNHLPIVQM